MGVIIRPAEYKDCPGIREFLLENTLSYPDIGSWWDSKVLPNLEQDRRIVFVVDVEDSIEGIFIGKPGKICTLKLHKSIRSQGVGKSLLMEGLDCLLDSGMHSINVTISEAAEEGCISFFESVGFQRIGTKLNRYRKGLDEFIYSCNGSSLIGLLEDFRKGQNGS